MVQEVEEVESVLAPILKKDVSKVGSRVTIAIADKQIDLNEQFKLILTTSNESIVNDCLIDLVSVISFSLTESGLESKFLSSVMSKFMPEIELKK